MQEELTGEHDSYTNTEAEARYFVRGTKSIPGTFGVLVKPTPCNCGSRKTNFAVGLGGANDHAAYLMSRM